MNCCNPEDESHRYRLPGTTVSLKSHQLVAVYRIVFSVEISGNLATLLADTMGLGKTFVVAGVVALFHAMHRAVAEIPSDRAKGATKQRIHCAKYDGPNPPTGSWTCPSGRYFRFGFSCPCIPGSKAHNLVRWASLMPGGPTVLVIPPGLVSQWCKELLTFFEAPSNSGQSSFTIMRFVSRTQQVEHVDGITPLKSYNDLPEAITRTQVFTVAQDGSATVS